MPAALGTRTLSSVLVVAVAALLVSGPPPLFTLLLLALAWLGVAEMYGMLSADGAPLPVPLGIALVTPPILAGALGGRDAVSLSVLLAGVAPLLWAMAGEPRPEALRLWALTAAGAIYVGWPLAHAQLLGDLPGGREWLLLAIACTWATDTGAYLTGSIAGRTKLAPRISPGKTVEGSAGALVLTALVGTAIAGLLGLGLGPVMAAALSVGLSVIVQLGDLAESYVKRVAGVKDSGTLLPGHGGLLDRIDGLLWVLVATYYLVAALA